MNREEEPSSFLTVQSRAKRKVPRELRRRGEEKTVFLHWVLFVFFFNYSFV